MKNHQKKIAGLIAKDTMEELTPRENEELDNWVNEGSNRQLLNAIKNSKNYSAWSRTREADTQPAWNKIYKVIQKQKKHSFLQKAFRVAASVLLPLLIGGGVYLFVSDHINKQATESTVVAQITPGTSKAVLVLDNGKSIVLDTPGEEEIREEDGTVIRKSEKKLDYTEHKINKKAKQPLYNTIRVPQGAEYDLLLSDGTRVFLNAKSEFRYPVKFSGEVRKVELTGEAYFEVTKSGTPFIVKTAQVSVEVMGTSFNVNAYESTEKVITTLVEGKVRVAATRHPEKACLLAPDEQAVFSLSDGSIEVEKVDVSLFTAWKDGELIFRDTRLEDIMITLTRWYSADVFYMNPSVKELRFSGSLNRYGDITQVLDIIKATNKVEVDVNGTTILFRERK
ncbi:FecR family protein [Mariniphaga anaerophila]|uniref:FecR family protein n=1 Tax=Mariniphaga anaerophila TaxID=1484053 RepID=A0A1M4Y4Y5_9BACT|nr:FecR domain-containing protein [Mariniphaga anaerophila]SHF00739.1 FecR family protein [Mariniphaga anaerophila]